jgi:hypothetical protein
MAVRARQYLDTTTSIFGSSKHRAKLPGVIHACAYTYSIVRSLAGYILSWVKAVGACLASGP